MSGYATRGRAPTGGIYRYQKYRKTRQVFHFTLELLPKGLARSARTLPRRAHLPTCSIDVPLFPADFADDPPDRPQDFIR